MITSYCLQNKYVEQAPECPNDTLLLVLNRADCNSCLVMKNYRSPETDAKIIVLEKHQRSCLLERTSSNIIRRKPLWFNRLKHIALTRLNFGQVLLLWRVYDSFCSALPDSFCTPSLLSFPLSNKRVLLKFKIIVNIYNTINLARCQQQRGLVGGQVGFQVRVSSY